MTYTQWRTEDFESGWGGWDTQLQSNMLSGKFFSSGKKSLHFEFVSLLSIFRLKKHSDKGFHFESVSDCSY